MACSLRVVGWVGGDGIMIQGSSIMITGGTGSFGNAALRSFLEKGAREIRVFSRDEKKQEDMRTSLRDERVSFHLGDVRELSSIAPALNGVDYVFHAAALKQVPSCEFFPIEAVRTNVLGTENVLNASVAAGVKRVVALSTDKAAYPINAMGISKAMMEKVVVAKARSIPSGSTSVSITRYGNVMASRGSVIPVFIRQIKNNEPLTITEPGMTRFLMSLNEAVELVDFAFNKGEAGDLFVQKAPSATVQTLALALTELFGHNPGIRIIGSRHGEKSFETLLTREEAARSEDLGEYFRVAADTRDLNYGKFLEAGSKEISDAAEFNSENAILLDVDAVKKKLLESEFVRMQLGDEAVEE